VLAFFVRSCLNCEACLGGQEATCSNAKLSGYTVDGSFQQCVDSSLHVIQGVLRGSEEAGGNR